MLPLRCEVKQYAWGRPGTDSLVAELGRASGHGTGKVDAGEPFAELWMGAHVSGPSRVTKTGESLADWLSRNPAALGDVIRAQFGASLPFLFKVLSVQKALSIQSHPDKELARQLHAERPEIYKDPNHKPEMALAVQDFEALCGFCDLAEISDALQRTPELIRCVGSHRAADLRHSMHRDDHSKHAALKATFTALMTCDEDVYAPAVDELQCRLRSSGACLCDKDELFLRVCEQYPRDVGCLAVYFLNHMKLHPGEAIYFAANEPHAYLSGQMIEAMASSDNVVRAGLTPKLRDTKVLCSSLTYNRGPPHMLRGEPVVEGMKLYQPPFEEFQVMCFHVEAAGVVAIAAQPSPMILLGLQSTGTHRLEAVESPVEDDALEMTATVSRGSVLFVPAGTPMALHSTPAPCGACTLLAYAATANDSMFVSASAAAHGATAGDVRKRVITVDELAPVMPHKRQKEEPAVMRTVV